MQSSSHNVGETSGRGWPSVLKAFNPLGPIAEAYAKTLAYKIETKRLDTELQRVREQRRLAERAIDATLKLKLEELSQRRLMINRIFDIAEKQLDHLHIERMEVIKTLRVAREGLSDRSISSEERRMFMELATHMSKDLPAFGERANQSLQALVGALPPVQMPGKLLE